MLPKGQPPHLPHQRLLSQQQLQIDQLEESLRLCLLENKILSEENQGYKNQKDYSWKRVLEQLSQGDQAEQIENHYKQQIQIKDYKIEQMQGDYYYLRGRGKEGVMSSRQKNQLEMIKNIKVNENINLDQIQKQNLETQKQQNKKIQTLQEELNQLNNTIQNIKFEKTDLILLNDQFIKKVEFLNKQQHQIKTLEESLKNTRKQLQDSETKQTELTDKNYNLQIQLEETKSQIQFITYKSTEQQKQLQNQNYDIQLLSKKLKEKQLKTETYKNTFEHELQTQIQLITTKYLLLKEKYDQDLLQQKIDNQFQFDFNQFQQINHKEELQFSFQDENTPDSKQVLKQLGSDINTPTNNQMVSNDANTPQNQQLFLSSKYEFVKNSSTNNKDKSRNVVENLITRFQSNNKENFNSINKIR